MSVVQYIVAKQWLPFCYCTSQSLDVQNRHEWWFM